MTSLFQVSREYTELFEQLDILTDNADPEEREETIAAWIDTLDGIKGEFEAKAESLAQYIKGICAMEKAIDEEIKALRERKESAEVKEKRLKQYLLDCMEHISASKIETAKAKISVRNNPESVVCESKSELIIWAKNNGREDLLRYKDPEISLTAVKESLKSGESIPGAAITRTKSIIIK